MQQGNGYMPDMTIYVTKEQRADMQRLAGLLDANGVDVRDKRGNISYSALFRYLIERELREQLAQQPAPAPGDTPAR